MRFSRASSARSDPIEPAPRACPFDASGTFPLRLIARATGSLHGPLGTIDATALTAACPSCYYGLGIVGIAGASAVLAACPVRMAPLYRFSAHPLRAHNGRPFGCADQAQAVGAGVGSAVPMETSKRRGPTDARILSGPC